MADGAEVPGLAEVPEDLEAAAPEAVAAVPDRNVLPDNEAALRERHRFLTGWNLGFGDVALFSICPE